MIFCLGDVFFFQSDIKQENIEDQLVALIVWVDIQRELDTGLMFSELLIIVF